MTHTPKAKLWVGWVTGNKVFLLSGLSSGARDITKMKDYSMFTIHVVGKRLSIARQSVHTCVLLTVRRSHTNPSSIDFF